MLSHSEPALLLAAALFALAQAPAAIAAPQGLMVVDTAGQPVAGAVVSVLVRGVRATAPSGTLAQLGQRNKQFEPTLLVVQTGTLVNFPNFDTVRHHVYSFSPARPFEIKLYAGTPAQPVLFDKPGTATLGCNIHDRMLAYVHVVDTPHFGVSDERGRLTIDLPGGEHTARIWKPAMGEKVPGQEVRFATTAAGAVTLRMNP
ncbi:methylamine utilization protein [Aquabacterium olei]|uniref:Methylamine utilization protein n=1 Tax=Aquabacterium olei TaxID=1296669 RepID=A0A2U8FUT9_9BURK|nr:methylamine utilization protein [Aquabacterium olei]AWI53996.1 methylamine utilization protein [Aquabacterium olei]